MAGLLVGLLVAGFAAFAWQKAALQTDAPLLATVTSPDGHYRIDCHALLGRDESLLLLRVQHLVGAGSPAEFSASFVNGAFRPGWDCGASGCTAFWWSARDQDRISLPPHWTARLRGQLRNWLAA